MRLDDALRPIDGAGWNALAQRAGEETFEQKLAAADGRMAWILWRVTWLGHAEGPPEFQAVGRDITRLRELQAKVERAQAEARQALVMRERLTIAHDLHDTIVHALVAVVAQLRLVRKLAERAPERVPEELARAEEALRNVERHAQASRVSVAAIVADGEIRIAIADNGRGFDESAAHPGHYGLAGIAEQAQMIGGKFAIQTSPGQGARLLISAPLVHQER